MEGFRNPTWFFPKANASSVEDVSMRGRISIRTFCKATWLIYELAQNSERSHSDVIFLYGHLSCTRVIWKRECRDSAWPIPMIFYLVTSFAQSGVAFQFRTGYRVRRNLQSTLPTRRSVHLLPHLASGPARSDIVFYFNLVYR